MVGVDEENIFIFLSLKREPPVDKRETCNENSGKETQQ